MDSSSFSPSTSHPNHYHGSRAIRNTKSSIFFCDQSSSDEKPRRYVLDSCFLCKTPIHLGDDIYMYKGDIPFCSEDCRQEQIEIDEAEERKKKLSKKLRLKANISGGNKNTSESYEIHVRTAEVVVAR
ncbi:uncharacterized protein A4U43_C04F12850 [Asparagus officinalis]|uniref:FLZ-type domain-containing protein n=1 Tax=Asparagus officinalis TaxID=4686 RepID=A0A5P1F0X2_ASPOF|nr:uncharacterized protein LOC109838508 [Asparagus officinalis]ONK71832.1 uncharacterized protein A4U43_C04F12850 [Asparagus officinalis]